VSEAHQSAAAAGASPAAAASPADATGPAAAASGGCGAPPGGHAAAVGAGAQAVLQGRVTRSGAAVPVGYARLLDPGGDFVAEVRLGEDGGFRFFPTAGAWTLRVLAPGGITAERAVSAGAGTVTDIEVAV
jgi:Protein of unknown function (DUF1416)